jgi:integrase/recombinase XerD
LPDLPKLSKNFTPYIFTKDQISLLFKASDQLKGTRNNLTSKVFIVPALLRLLYGTGLRVSEALSLSCNDINIKSKYLILRHTKNGKERLVPISDSLCEVCKQYLDYRKNFPIVKDSNCLFINPDGSPCNIHAAYKWFRRVLYKAKIPHAGKGLGPRLHDLRHTFSVHTLAGMAEAGEDLYYSLPVLSTYLGHQSIGATDKYIRLTAEMYPSIIAKINEAFPFLFPEIYHLIENETN